MGVASKLQGLKKLWLSGPFCIAFGSMSVFVSCPEDMLAALKPRILVHKDRPIFPVTHLMPTDGIFMWEEITLENIKDTHFNSTESGQGPKSIYIFWPLIFMSVQ